MDTIVANDIAKFFLEKSNLTQKKIQKLVYYSYAWFIALNNQDINDINNVLFDENPEAWVHGPVFPSLYSIYKANTWHEIEGTETAEFSNTDLISFLNDVWDKYGDFSADQLEYFTHQERPWKEAREALSDGCSSNNKINSKAIFSFYNSVIQSHEY